MNLDSEVPADLHTDTSTTRDAMSVDGTQPPRLDFTVVGIGASAGGLEAFSELFDVMPATTGMSFVLIQHLSPNRESMVAELLQRHTSMPVRQVEDGMLVEPNHVYVIRPGHTMTIKDGHLHLGESVKESGHSRPVDDFFRSLAEEQRERSICVIMSGMGSNGTGGAQAVKVVGGVCIAQDPGTAKFPSMPRSLIDANLADFILKPQDIPEALLRYSRDSYVTDPESPEMVARRESQQINEILAILRTRVRHDFTGYKRPTIVRRIQRRMSLTQQASMADYARMLRHTAAEVINLSDDLMIHVTGFFRDQDVWRALEEKVIAPLVVEKQDRASIRVWVTACATGEEAYTLAMLLVDAAQAAGKQFDIKVFATDMAERALAHARAGIFPGGIESEISPERLARYFDRDDAVYRVKKELRELVVFAPQNVLQDPPFSRLDIVTCRNLLIYLEPPMQQRLLALLHFGLREGGVLVLGNSETIGEFDEFFEPVDKRLRIFRRLGPTRHGLIEFPMPRLPNRQQAEASDPSDPRAPQSRASLTQITNRLLLDAYTPPSVVVDRRGRIAYFHGDTALFLDQPRGEPTREILVLARDFVRGSLRVALHQAIESGARSTVKDGTIHVDGSDYRVEVCAEPLDRLGVPGFYLLSFSKYPVHIVPYPISADGNEQQVADELRTLRDELQSTIEELQASNEEMKASNEEVTSVNEELQSSNEELETGKEELQSLNEELTTVNAQLQAKMYELERTSNDLNSLLSSTDIAVIFLDTQFRIRRFTPAVKQLMDLIASDVGRPLSDLARKFTDPDLVADAGAVLETLQPCEREIRDGSGRWYSRRVLPYRTADNRIDGVVVTFVNITARKEAEAEVAASGARILEAEQLARGAAESANSAKDQFLATVSHELRTPLSAMMLWSRVLKDTSGHAENLARGIAAIERGARSQQKLIDDLMDSARISSGKLTLELRPVDLTSVVRTAIDTIRPGADAKGLEIHTEFGEGIGIVLADSDRLIQVVWNLVSNAAKFTPSGGRIDIGLWRHDGEIEIRVADTGMGLHPDDIPDLFQRFRQAYPTNRRHGGLGLGLAISRQLAELHGGSITATSDGPGQGSVFVVRLPLAKTTGFVVPADANPVQNGDLGPVKLLVVEDDEPTREVLKTVLRRAGATVRAVPHAEAALAAFNSEVPDLLISDIGLPDKDGFALMRELRANEPIGQRVRALAFTAFDRPGDRETALTSGFDECLGKPVDALELINVLQRMLLA